MKNLLIVLVLVITGCATQEMLMVRHMNIKDVDISKIRDGQYIGDFSYCGFKYEVETIVNNHKIQNIMVLHNRDTRHAKRAEGVISEILKNQTPNVDAISGATTTSKALMKAVENSLNTHASNGRQ
jgi:uncharacterized protein with FMN-binding domain